MKRGAKLVFFAIGILVFVLFFVRLVLPSQVDDVNPFRNCSENILAKADVYYVIPKLDGVDINNVSGWCEEISSKDKEFAMHGVYHTFEEFGVYRDEEFFNEGVEIFETCFGKKPIRFKPGQLKWTAENDWIKGEVKVDLFWNQVFHKVYHCGDSGVFPNWFIRVF